MLQVTVLTGKKAGSIGVARHFPFGIGRAADQDLSLADEGIWDRHLVLELTPEDRVTLTVQSEAMASVNGEPFRQIGLRNGDVVACGSVQLQFWLSEPRQGGLIARERLTWIALGILVMAEVALMLGLR